MSSGKKGLKSLSGLKQALVALKPEFVANIETKARAVQSRAFLALGVRKHTRGHPSPPPLGVSEVPTRVPSVVDDFKFQILREEPGQSRTASAGGIPNAHVAPGDLRGEDALKHVLKAIRAVRFSVAEARPAKVSPNTSKEIDRRISRGAEILRGRPGPDPDGYIIGMDFGTSSTKIIVHQPFAAGDPSKALPVPPELRSGGIQHLWQTALWYSPTTGNFSLFPTPGSVVLEGFKAGLIQGLGGQSDAAGVPRCFAAAAYLGLLFAYVIGYFAEAQPLGRTEANHYAALHLGIPVASKDDPRIRPEFQRIAGAARAIAQYGEGITLENVQKAYTEASPGPGASLAGINLYGELEGVIAGYLATPDHRPGAHMVVDVGASTLDVATFRLYDWEGERRADVYATAVEMLGAEALGWSRLADIPDDCFRRACSHVTWRPFHLTRTKRDRGYDRTTSKQPVMFLLVGGGRHTDLHGKLFGVGPKDDYLRAPTRTPIPTNRTVSERGVEFSRLLVAYGLSRDPSLLPATRLPSQIEDEPSRVRNLDDRYISKDLV